MTLEPSSQNLGRIRRMFQPGIEALSRLWLPFVVIQAFGLIVVLAYFYVPSFAHACDAIGVAKARLGLLFAALTMPIAAGLMPEVFKFITGVDRSLRGERLRVTLHNMILFSMSGMCVDVFYNWLGWLFAGAQPVISVPAKVLVDQLIYTPIIGVPIISWSYSLRAQSYRPLPALREITPVWYEREVMPVLVVCWAYWFPMCSLMYTLPTSLTFVYGMIANAAAATLLTAIAARHERKLANA
jgi:hypothetical protein